MEKSPSAAGLRKVFIGTTLPTSITSHNLTVLRPVQGRHQEDSAPAIIP